MDNPYRESSSVNPQRENGRREVNNEVWRALMCAGLSGGEYQVLFTIIDQTWGFNRTSSPISLDKFEKVTQLSRQGVIKSIKKVEQKHIILVERDKTKITAYMFNKFYDTWVLPASQPQLTTASEPALTSEDKQLVNQRLLSWSTTVHQSSQPQLTTASKLAVPGTEPVKKYIKETIKETIKEIYSPLFDKWNSLNIIKHKALTEKMKLAIKSAASAYSKDELEKAMENYAEILHGDEYRWTYKWTLDEFFRRGLEKFMDIEVARQNNLIRGERINGKPERRSPERKHPITYQRGS